MLLAAGVSLAVGTISTPLAAYLIVAPLAVAGQVPLPLGFDRFSTDRHTFSNREFLLNAIDYMLDDNGVITARNKDFKIRLLDTLRLRKYRVQYQLLNVVGPVLLIALLGGVWFYVRRKKYA